MKKGEKAKQKFVRFFNNLIFKDLESTVSQEDFVRAFTAFLQDRTIWDNIGSEQTLVKNDCSAIVADALGINQEKGKKK